MPDTSKITVLIADDQRIARLGLRTILEDFPDVEVVGEAEDGESAVKLAEQLAPKVVLVDVRKSVMTGVEVVKQMKNSTPQVKIIILTDSDDDLDALDAMAAGADGYCLKQSNIDKLGLIIRAVNEGLSCLDSSVARQLINLNTFSKHRESNKSRDQNQTACGKFGLSARELEVIALVKDGLTNSQIAERLFLSVDTVKNHMRYILAKLSVSDRTQAAVKAMREGLI